MILFTLNEKCGDICIKYQHIFRMKENEIDRVLADYIAGEELSVSDQQFLEEWKREFEKNEWLDEELRKLKESGKEMGYRKDKYAVFARIDNIVKRQRERRLLIRWLSVAAGIVLLVGVTSYFMFLRENQVPVVQLVHIVPGTPKAELVLPEGKVIQLDTSAREIVVSGDRMRVASRENTLVYGTGGTTERVEYHMIRVPRGAEYNLQLSDNTRVFLNSGSSLRYPVRFTGNVREVFLSGEGYFEVTKDATRPFVVKAEEVEVRVLGTSFNVNAYPEENVIETTLVNGKVQVDHGTKENVLTPGMQLVYDRINGISNVREVDIEVYTSWKDGYYYFKRESLEKIMDILARWYNLNVFFQNPDLKTMEFGGRLKRYEDITYLLKKMEETQDVQFVINGNAIMIKRKTD